jgi:GMP synthase (glutamine-hydrolysing)
MGTVQLELHPQAESDPLFGGLPAQFPAQATHLQSVLRAPEGATVLAKSVHDACHAFRWGDRAWGVQFHPEFDAEVMRGYVDHLAGELRALGTEPDVLRSRVAGSEAATGLLRRFAGIAEAHETAATPA